MKADWTNELADYFENSCMYDSATPYTALPDTRGNCLALATQYVELAASDWGIHYPKVCLLNVGDPAFLEHAVVYGDDGANIPWVVDLAYGITRPLLLNGYRRYFSFEDKGEEGLRLNLGSTVYRIDNSKGVVSTQHYNALQFAYQFLSQKFSIFPIYSAGINVPFAVKVELPEFRYRRWGSLIVSGKFNNGSDDEKFQQLTEMFFLDMRTYYGVNNIPFRSEKEFLDAVASFLNGYVDLITS